MLVLQVTVKIDRRAHMLTQLPGIVCDNIKINVVLMTKTETKGSIFFTLLSLLLTFENRK